MSQEMPKKKRKKQPDLIDMVGMLLSDMADLGYSPVLIGGMALVTYGSTRVTRDFDFLIAQNAREDKKMIRLFYRHDLELVARLDSKGNVTGTIDNAKVAAARIKIDKPNSAYFYNRDQGLKIDLLFDFPILAETVLANAVKKKVKSYTLTIASKKDLVRLKQVAVDNREFSSDKQDLEFLYDLDESDSG
jgi:hypothetical protein